MDKLETAIAVIPNHDAAEGAVRTLTAAGFAMKNLSVVGKGYSAFLKPPFVPAFDGGRPLLRFEHAVAGAGSHPA